MLCLWWWWWRWWCGHPAGSEPSKAALLLLALWVAAEGGHHLLLEKSACTEVCLVSIQLLQPSIEKMIFTYVPKDFVVKGKRVQGVGTHLRWQNEQSEKWRSYNCPPPGWGWRRRRWGWRSPSRPSSTGCSGLRAWWSYITYNIRDKMDAYIVGYERDCRKLWSV